MTYRNAGIRILAMLLLLVTLVGAIAKVSAEESEPDLGSTALGGASVSVSCTFDELADTSSCAFTPTTDSGAVTSLFVPAEVLCAPVASTTAASVDGGLAQDLAGDSLWITFTGSVSASGGASYVVGIDGVGTDAGGDGLSCSTGDIDSGDPEDVTSDPTQEPETDLTPEATPEQGGEAEPTVEATTEPTEPTVEPTTENTDQGEENPPVETQGDPVPQVTVNVVVYTCTTDPGAGDPSVNADCAFASGVNVSATADTADAGTQATNGSGLASFTVPEGSAVVLTEDVTSVQSGFQPIGGAVRYLIAADGRTATIVNLAKAVAGRLQIVSGTCPTSSGDDYTTFRVIEPRSVAAASVAACEVTPGAAFQIYGGSLGDGGITVYTGGDGAWRGYLPPGTYTVQDDSGESADVTLIADDISVVIVVDYVSSPLGVLNISRFECENAETSGLHISFSFSKPANYNDSDCEVTNGDVEIDVQSEVSAASVTTITLGPDGTAEIELPPGSYVLTDTSTHESASFDLAASSRVYALIEDLVLGDDGVGPGTGGGGNNGGGDGTGNPGGSNGGNNGGSNGGSNGGNNGGNTGGNNGGGSGNGNGNGSNTGGDGSTSGGVDAGTTDDLTDGQEIASVNTLPLTGARDGGSNADELLLALVVLGGGLAAGAAITQRRVRKPAA